MTKRNIVTDFEVMRDVMPNGLVALPCPRGKPLRVLTLLDEQDFAKERCPIHHRNVFYEDHIHDWDYRDGKLYYYSRVRTHSEHGNAIVLVYGTEDVEVKPRFCTETGRPLTDGA